MAITEKRVLKRISVSIEGELTTNGISYVAFVNNISENGVSTIITPLSTSSDINSRTDFHLKFKLPSGEDLDLNCRKKWSVSLTSHGLTKKLGMEIVDPPARYKEFIKNL
jgi:hypothetical protein